ncbi:hypothetical protein [Schaalia hyovaginalis]|uniref:Uncharacterized protein n=1 Tax=Schaalia hyovaginalis TaxID=29316 RepID=A0A923E6E8_9ACTO|nr:hypothetical protein [Schaalia hyovaginalis]MBB6335505.1 hypothetical protein [Schaalia hyovaginalis]MDY2669279.1 hypothetical protein [Schaalia hyovaginalis]
MNETEFRLSSGYLLEVAKRYSNAQEQIDAAAEAVPLTVDVGDVAEMVDSLTSRIVDLAKKLTTVCELMNDSLREVVKSVELDDQGIANALKRVDV